MAAANRHTLAASEGFAKAQTLTKASRPIAPAAARAATIDHRTGRDEPATPISSFSPKNLKKNPEYPGPKRRAHETRVREVSWQSASFPYDGKKITVVPITLHTIEGRL